MLHISHDVLKQCLGEVWAEYLEFCKKEQRKTQKVNARLEKDYKKEYAKHVTMLPPTVNREYKPPVMRSIYDTPSFEGMMQWVTQGIEHKATDPNPSEITTILPKELE